MEEAMASRKTVHGQLPPIPFSLSGYGGFKKEVAPFHTQIFAAESQPPQGRVEQDTKKLRRVLASRQYSQKYRLKQLHYILQLETEVKALQAEVAITSPRIKYVDCQNSLLRAENGSMKKRLSAFSGELTFKEAQYQELKEEREMLKQLYQQQQQQDLVKNKPGQIYNQLESTSFIQSGLNQFQESHTGIPRQMINQNLNIQFGTARQNSDVSPLI